VRPLLKRVILVALLFLVSAYCLLGALAVADLSAGGDPSAPRRFYTWLAASFALGIVATWQLVVMLKRHGRENLL
jgi:hypothetical protein